MKRYFSPSTRCFHIEGIGQLPDDAVSVTAEIVLAMQQAKEQGQTIQAGENGQPVAVAGSAVLSLETLRTQKANAIQQEKNRVKNSGFTVLLGDDSVRFDSDSAAQIAYMQLQVQLAANASLSLRWKASGSTWVTMDAALCTQVQAANKAHTQACFAWQDERDAALEVAMTAEEISAVALDLEAYIAMQQEAAHAAAAVPEQTVLGKLRTMLSPAGQTA